MFKYSIDKILLLNDSFKHLAILIDVFFL